VIGISEEVVGEGVVRLEVEGELDMATAPKLATHLARAMSDGATQAVVDLERVSFIDSTGLGVLISSVRRLRRRGGDLTIVCSQERILKAFKVTGVDQMLTVEPTGA
jgi:anti-sigma B factor antagonist